jgi:outer membrane protein assembly factor BamB
VIVAIAAWWAWQAKRTGYQTLGNVIAVLVGLLLISGWFITYGGGRRRLRLWSVGLLWLTLGLLFAIFRPIYNGDMGIVTLRLRFARTADERLTRLAGEGQADDWHATPQDYPGFLGGGHWPEVPDVLLETDWQNHPPQEIWRREIGAGWSAFAVVGSYAVTQEQRGEQELVACYRVADGSPVWTHADVARFDPGGSGGLGRTGPRATPTIVGERVFTQGATGIVNCLDARTGDVLWSHDTLTEFGADVTLWGKSGSPLVVDDTVVISVGAPADGTTTSSPSTAAVAPARAFNASLVAFDKETGSVRWTAGNRQASYASPILATFAGVRQIVVINQGFVTAHDVRDGRVLWEHPWPDELDATPTAAQPIPLAGDRLFLSKGYGVGASLIEVTRSADGEWNVRSLWEPPIRPVMKTKFSNIVVRDGYAYGLDDVLLSCVELETGRVMWRNRRSPAFGHGQVLLAGDVLIVLSEQGELALVEVSPERYRELAQLQVLAPVDVTWNNPALSPPFLLIRNAREAACFRLPMRQ